MDSVFRVVRSTRRASTLPEFFGHLDPAFAPPRRGDRIQGVALPLALRLAGSGPVTSSNESARCMGSVPFHSYTS